MSTLSFARAAHRRLKDVLCPEGVVFHHVPKCGGTSVGRSLRKAYLVSQGTVTPELSYGAFATVRKEIVGDDLTKGVFELREMMLAYLLCSDVRCVSAHIPFSRAVHERFADTHKFVTILRDPVARFISHYLWSHNRPEAHGYIPEELEEFLTTARARAMGATYARYFCGSPWSTSQVLSAGVEPAIEHLRRLDVVGFLDDMLGFELSLRAMIGKRIKIGFENVGRQKEAHRQIIESSLYQEVRRLCEPDLAIWSAIQGLRDTPKAGRL